MKSVAILLDGGFVLKRLYRLLGNRHPEATDVVEFARACAAQDEEIFRIYYYDCPPIEETLRNPLAPEREINFAVTSTARRKQRLQNQLSIQELVAFRRGYLSFEGWSVSRQFTNRVIRDSDTSRVVNAEHLHAEFRQKTVDMKIGLDVAWLASKRIVDRLLLATADNDFIPAMKFARREGTQVVLVPMGTRYLKSQLREHADFVRDVAYPETSSQTNA
ncbi:MAG: NYN domain-containing protein [Phycisphaerae bacterium]